MHENVYGAFFLTNTKKIMDGTKMEMIFLKQVVLFRSVSFDKSEPSDDFFSGSSQTLRSKD